MRILTGKRFGYWQVLSYAGTTKYRHPQWWCRCVCGKMKKITTRELVLGITKSCGCVNRVKNGLSNTREANIYEHMINRCYNPKDREYHNYGGRGIKVCQRWLDDFQNFLKDMGKAPPNATIDRIDNDGDYCPENCRWASNFTQSRNRRNNVKITYKGKTLCLQDWADKLGISYATLRKRLKYLGWSVEEAFTITPKFGQKVYKNGSRNKKGNENKKKEEPSRRQQ